MDNRNVLVVDDHPLFREGLKALLARHPGFVVVGEAETGKEGLVKAKELSPDVVLIDLTLAESNGIELTKNIREVLPDAQVAIVTVHSGINYITEAFRAGAKGYVVKESASERLIDCLESVSRGECYLDPSLSEKVVESLMTLESKEPRIEDAGYGALTDREQQVMRLITEGLRTRDIARSLKISPKTVETHRARLMGKLDLHSTLDLMRYAARIGLIDMRGPKD